MRAKVKLTQLQAYIHHPAGIAGHHIHEDVFTSQHLPSTVDSDYRRHLVVGVAFKHFHGKFCSGGQTAIKHPHHCGVAAHLGRLGIPGKHAGGGIDGHAVGCTFQAKGQWVIAYV